METFQVEAPQTIGDTGVSETLLQELALKTLFLNGEMSVADLADRMCLSIPVAEEIFQSFRREKLCEVKGMVRGTHVIMANSLGKERAVNLISLNQYAGPAPVSLEDYSARVRAQSVQRALIEPSQLKLAFENLVLSESLITRLGTSIASGMSIFLYGPSGTGKTTIAYSIGSIYTDVVLIPYAIEVDRQIVAIYDPSVHQKVKGSVRLDWDCRWFPCYRPRVITGGELSSEMLDVQISADGRYLTAPLQLKANNGIFVVDDFGRQRIRSEELLNRWMTPLDRRLDFLMLPGGKKFEIPFDQLVVFSTNQDPRTITDEAFLRRMPNKIKLDHATPEQFMEIFRRECARRQLDCEDGIAKHLVALITEEMKQPLSHNLARDLLNQITWSASYQAIEPKLNGTTLRQACLNYFLTAD